MQNGYKNMKDITSIEQADETTLWNLLTEGNRKALEIIYQRYYLLLLNYGLKCTSDRELIKDCIHDLFVHLYQDRNGKEICWMHLCVSYLLMKISLNRCFHKTIMILL